MKKVLVKITHSDGYIDNMVCDEDFALDIIEDSKNSDIKYEIVCDLDKIITDLQSAQRSDLWNQIFSIIDKLKLDHSGNEDRMDKPSCTTALEELFLKLMHNVKTKS